MYVQNITYTDFDGNTRTDECRFHLSAAELTEMQESVPGGFKAYLEKMVAEHDGPGIMNAFKMLLRKSYGVKSPDGKRFIKTDENWNEFMESNAYDEFFMKLVTDEVAAKAFADGVMPDMSKYTKSVVK